MCLIAKTYIITLSVILFTNESSSQLQLASAPKSKPLDATKSKPTADAAKSKADAAKPATYSVGGPRPSGDSTNDDGLLGSLLKIIFGGSRDDESDSYERYEKRKDEIPTEPSPPSVSNPEKTEEELNEERQKQEEDKRRQEEERRTRHEERVREHKRKHALRINTEAGRDSERRSNRKSPQGRSVLEEESNTEISLTPEKEVDTQISSPACDLKSSDDMNKIVELREKLDEKLEPNSMVYNYSRGDNYPLRWLIGCNYEVEKCVDAIAVQHVKWREALEVDKIHEVDWSEYETKYPLYHSSVDKDGRPVVEFWLKEWNVAAAAEQNLSQLAKWFVKMFELVTRKMYQLNVVQQKCTTQSIMLVDVEDYSEEKQGCEKCMQLYSLFAAIYETHYPNLFMNIHFINADQNNRPFIKMLSQMVGALKQRDRALSSFKLHYDKALWMNDLDKIIDKDQRSERFGGTKKF